ncbi:MAG: sigma-70 family RNA polymerase sigma factor [Oscillospiraceae bacterium]
MLDLNLKEDILSDMSDEELAAISSENSRAVSVLISRYSAFIRSKARAMAAQSADADDLAQEGLLGFINAISKFNPQKKVKFFTFAYVCVINRMKSMLHKNSDSVELLDDISEYDDYVIPDNPESIFISKEHLNELYDDIISILSDMEWNVFRLFLKDYSYEQIASSLDISVKSVNNAMMRIRKKLKSAWNTEDFK